MRCGLTTFLNIIGLQNGVLVLGLGVPEVPTWRPKTGSYELFSFQDNK
jgi:hypothetical protein